MNKLDLEETTRRFHNVYEQVAKEYGYKTREDTKELDFNSPNGMTMLKTVETITTPYLEEIERLNSIINNDFSKICREKMIDKLSANEMILLQDKEIERLNNIIDKAKEKSIYLQERYGYILDDLTFMLMQGSDKE